MKARSYGWGLGLLAAASVAAVAYAGGLPAKLLSAASRVPQQGVLPQASSIESLESAQGAEAEFVGPVDSIGATQWVISGVSVEVTSETEIGPGILVGSLVKVHASVDADGRLLAREIELAEGAADEDSDAADDPGEPPELGEDFHFSGTVESMGADAWVIGGTTFAVDGNTQIDSGIAVGTFVRVEALVVANGAPLALEIESDAPDDDDDGDQDEGEELEFFGTVDAIGADSWTIAGMTFLITADTEIDEGLVVGSLVKVEATGAADGLMTATEIEQDGDDDDGNSGPGGGDDEDEDDEDEDEDDDDNSGPGGGEDDDDSGHGGDDDEGSEGDD